MRNYTTAASCIYKIMYKLPPKILADLFCRLNFLTTSLKQRQNCRLQKWHVCAIYVKTVAIQYSSHDKLSIK